ncbi:MAG: dihydropteroate synthase, partial [Paracoccaceae bacterium]
LPVCVMHANGDPETMQVDPRYDDVLLDVYDFLEAQILMLREAGVPRDQIIVDPGIGFGKTMAHNLALLNRLSLFHSLGCPVLLGASRKKFIGTLSGVPDAKSRLFGSVGVALAAAAQGVQILRVHDVPETRQALDLWLAVQRGVA